MELLCILIYLDYICTFGSFLWPDALPDANPPFSGLESAVESTSYLTPGGVLFITYNCA